MVSRLWGEKMSYLEHYANKLICQNKRDLADAIIDTAEQVYIDTISEFSYMEHSTCLLVGNVQSGKTSHVFGVITKAADEGFGMFIFLTTDNIRLQQQTLKRVEKELTDFCVCGEEDYIKFAGNGLKKPAIIVLKKNGHVLRKWKNNLLSTNFIKGNPLFILDDEADVASLNTKVNKNEVSTINANLSEIKRTSSSSIYMQVTGTPQSVLLQTVESGWQPDYIYTFRPGEKYIGGNFFFSKIPNPSLIITNDSEADEIIIDDEYPENELKHALFCHLITSSQLFLEGEKVCNFLIHPSMKTEMHEKFAEKVGDYLNDLALNVDYGEIRDGLYETYLELKETYPKIFRFEDIYSTIKDFLEKDLIYISIINSKTKFAENTQYELGNNILIGGNSVGRGITFPKLQTIYYCRTAKKPQADTMWQHSRMFGYDRKKGLLRVFMPSIVAKLFAEINEMNNIIIAQIEKSHNINEIKMFYSEGLHPTRKSVIDTKSVGLYVGGANYFPFDFTNRDIKNLDEILNNFSEEYNFVSLKLLSSILGEIISKDDNWSSEDFISFLNSYLSVNPREQGVLIVRKNRDIGKGTGTMLSPNDRLLGDSFKDNVVLTLYKLTGNKGWNGEQLWMPNIKLPEGVVYYYLNSK